MATTAELRAIRQMQRTAAERGDTLSFSDARDQLKAQKAAQNVAGADAADLKRELAALKSEIDTLREAVNGMRVTGEGFSGQGPRGIMFTPLETGLDMGTAVKILDEGTLVMNSANTFNFVGGGVVAEIDATNPRQINVTITGGDGSADIVVTDEGDAVTSVMTSLDVVGSGLTATSVGGAVTLTYAFTVQDEGSDVGTDISKINFIGAGVGAAAGGTADVVNVTIPGTAVVFQDEGSPVVTTATVNFVGDGVDVEDDGGVAKVTIPGGEAGYAPITAVFFKFDGTDITPVQVTTKVKDEATFP